jgi:hypothetical protein
MGRWPLKDVRKLSALSKQLTLETIAASLGRPQNRFEGGGSNQGTLQSRHTVSAKRR